MKVGLNIPQATYHTTWWWHVDVAKWVSWGIIKTHPERPWEQIPSDPGVNFDLDENGWPRNLPAQYVMRGLTLRDHFHYPEGNYLFKAKGKGTIIINFSTNTRIELSGGETVLEIPLRIHPDGTQIQIVASDPNDHVRDIRLYMPGFDDGDVFHPKVIEHLRSVSGALRFMDMSLINGSNIEHWSQVTKEAWNPMTGLATTYSGPVETIVNIPTNPFWHNWGDIVRVTAPNHGLKPGVSVTFDGLELGWGAQPIRVVDKDTIECRSGRPLVDGELEGKTLVWRVSTQFGVPYEYMIDLCNATDRDIWLCLPALANVDYIQKLAQLVKSRLKPTLKVYLEWSNEIWNFMFPQFKTCQSLGEANGLWFHPQYAKSARTIFTEFEKVFPLSRLVRVIAGQTAGPHHVEEILKYMEGQFDAVSCTTYFSTGIEEFFYEFHEASTADELLDFMLDNFDICSWGWGNLRHGEMARQYSEALGREIKFICYEGGQHIAGQYNLNGLSPEGQERAQKILYEIQTHPKMGLLYDRMFEDFAKHGGHELALYHYIGLQTKWGSWGHVEFQDEDLSKNVKWQSLLKVQGVIEEVPEEIPEETEGEIIMLEEIKVEALELKAKVDAFLASVEGDVAKAKAIQGLTDQIVAQLG